MPQFAPYLEVSLMVDMQVEGRLFSFVHFEAPQPAISYLIELQQNIDTCGLTAKR